MTYVFKLCEQSVLKGWFEQVSVTRVVSWQEGRNVPSREDVRVCGGRRLVALVVAADGCVGDLHLLSPLLRSSMVPDFILNLLPLLLGHPSKLDSCKTNKSNSKSKLYLFHNGNNFRTIRLYGAMYYI